MVDEYEDRDPEGARWSEWMRAAQEGESATYEKLLREILPMIRATTLKRMRNPDRAEDVVQNVLLSVHRSRHTYQPTRAFKPWLRAVIRNAITDSARSRRNEWRHQEFEEHKHPSEDPGPAENEEWLSQPVANALSKLPAGQREAVELLHLEGLSVKEGAARLGIQPSAFKVRAHRGRQLLQNLLRGKAR
jgi:RNA polymerase sigma-70 factor (ECF subfamily)